MQNSYLKLGKRYKMNQSLHCAVQWSKQLTDWLKWVVGLRKKCSPWATHFHTKNVPIFMKTPHRGIEQWMGACRKHFCNTSLPCAVGGAYSWRGAWLELNERLIHSVWVTFLFSSRWAESWGGAARAHWFLHYAPQHKPHARQEMSTCLLYCTLRFIRNTAKCRLNVINATFQWRDWLLNVTICEEFHIFVVC